jgi:hypothetical protein
MKSLIHLDWDPIGCQFIVPVIRYADLSGPDKLRNPLQDIAHERILKGEGLEARWGKKTSGPSCILPKGQIMPFDQVKQLPYCSSSWLPGCQLSVVGSSLACGALIPCHRGGDGKPQQGASAARGASVWKRMLGQPPALGAVTK